MANISTVQSDADFMPMFCHQNFLYKCLGVILRKSTKKDLVTKHLDIIFSSIKHTDQTEREVCVAFIPAKNAPDYLTSLLRIYK